ncbi:hypothetical protein [Caballeronia sp. M1242]|uniref:hypothetical protein n=1 Tax=Caballeronia sp. M1242 TaxID=2814653 RepID=UPI0019D18978|nr:hypothetical protein [Caballeronia sp. M1242]QSN63518.1 hypothetical protein JYK05_14955 [Caballeronia sp. M1242]
MKRRSFLTLAAMTPLLLSGCVTSELIETANSDDRFQYTETIDSVLISADRNKLVFLGADYHYIFDAPTHFADVLSSAVHPLIHAEVTTFDVGPDGKASGAFDLKISDASKLTPEAKAQLIDFGFSERNWTRRILLNGTRYSAKHFDRSKLSPTVLNQSYQVTVYETRHSNMKKVALLLTPVTVALDGALMILSIPLIPVAVVMLSKMRIM